MLIPAFDALRGRMIAEGFTPRYARRLTGELSDHFEDLRNEATAAGSDPESAARRARTRIGTDEAILERVRAAGRHRSLARRRPVLCFIIAPAVTMAIVTFVLAVSVAVLAEFVPLGEGSSAPVLSYVATRLILPAAAALLMLGWIAHAHRRRCPMRWPLLAGGVFMIICSVAGIHVMSPSSDLPGTIAIGIGAPSQNWAVVLPFMVSMAYWLLARRRVAFAL